MKTTLIAAFALMADAAFASEAPRLGLPADCDLGAECFIQQYHDIDPGPAAQDFMCEGLSYDGHKGTDIALPSLAAMEAGVAVIAAAPGIIKGTRDGMEDRLFSSETEGALEGRDCGNGVVIDHGNGWETQYCHLARGSVAVQSGERVTRGAALGRIGLSGRTQFPHVHLSLRKDGVPVDPFRPGGGCGGPGVDALWIDAPEYRPGGLIAAGLSIAVPDYDAIKAGRAAIDKLAADAQSLVAWGYGFGARAGDVMHLSIIAPGGKEVFSHEVILTRAQAQYFRAAGLRADGPWTKGAYTARIDLLRGGRVIDSAEGRAEAR